ncbi:hypothetical protein DL96DRAFT_1644769 [Flagelloscypha sp. PMI_526]|nr:hypothetical protein DL96DRAFT_1644769 [Flagelloscypha sp. PMI_526]
MTTVPMLEYYQQTPLPPYPYHHSPLEITYQHEHIPSQQHTYSYQLQEQNPSSIAPAIATREEHDQYHASLVSSTVQNTVFPVASSSTSQHFGNRSSVKAYKSGIPSQTTFEVPCSPPETVHTTSASVEGQHPLTVALAPAPIMDYEDSPSPTRSPTSATTKASSQRKEPSNVVIACQQCRSRKIKCDSTRPHCYNCARRQLPCAYDLVPKRRGPDKRPGTRQRSCKKRPAEGEGRKPQKGITKNRKRRSPPPPSSPGSALSPQPGKIVLTSPDGGGSGSQPVDSSRNLRIRTDPDTLASAGGHFQEFPGLISPPQPILNTTSPSPSAYGGYRPPSFDATSMQLPVASPTSAYPSTSYSPYLSYPGHGATSPATGLSTMSSPPIGRTVEQSHPKYPPPSAVALQHAAGWWEELLKSYRLEELLADIHYLNGVAPTQFSVINLHYLCQLIANPTQRIFIQPSLIYILLAHSNFYRSSEHDHISQSRRARASWLLKASQANLDAAWTSAPSPKAFTWVDAGLASTAYFLAVFENSAHELYSAQRAEKSLHLLDEIIERLSLLQIDALDRGTVKYTSSQPPVVPMDMLFVPDEQSATSALIVGDEPQLNCRCVLPSDQQPNPYANCSYVLPWNPGWTSAEIRQEEIRRVCWASLGLISDFLVTRVTFGQGIQSAEQQQKESVGEGDAGLLEGMFFMARAENYSILFPGEALDRVSPAFTGPDSLSPKESVWALYSRSMLLWHYATRLAHSSQVAGKSPKSSPRPGPHPTSKLRLEDIAELAQETWSEAQGIEDSLNMHICNIDTTMIYCCREYIFNTRMTIAQVFRRFHGLDNAVAQAPGPMFNRKQAEAWLYYQDATLKRVKMSLSNMNEVPADEVRRRPGILLWFHHQLVVCLFLWRRDQSLNNALNLGKSLLGPIDTLNSLWPSKYLRDQKEILRNRLGEACRMAGLPLPEPSVVSPAPPSITPPIPTAM